MAAVKSHSRASPSLKHLTAEYLSDIQQEKNPIETTSENKLLRARRGPVVPEPGACIADRVKWSPRLPDVL